MTIKLTSQEQEELLRRADDALCGYCRKGFRCASCGACQHCSAFRYSRCGWPGKTYFRKVG